MDSHFENDEKLYRAVFPETKMPNFWKKNGKLSSAALKKKDGLSVERGYYRKDEDVLADMKKSFQGNVVSVTVGQCRDVSAVVSYLPSERSKYHSEIHSSETKLRLTDSQAYRLSDVAIIEYRE